MVPSSIANSFCAAIGSGSVSGSDSISGSGLISVLISVLILVSSSGSGGSAIVTDKDANVVLGAASPCSSSQLCLASPQLRPNLRSQRIGTLSSMASIQSRATISACSRVATEQSRQSCICNSGTMTSRQQAAIQSL